MGADFWAEFHGNLDSNVEDEEDVAPVEPRPLAPESDTESDGEENEQESSDPPNWKGGATQPNFMRFDGASGLQIKIADDGTPLDYLHLMIYGDLVEQITTENIG